jgi:CubicO group peptidase (beta-lactamase class C family)
MREDPLARAVDALLDEVVGSGQDVGVQVAVIRIGHTLVDTARGVSDPCTGALVDRDTQFWAGSTAKGIASTSTRASPWQ